MALLVTFNGESTGNGFPNCARSRKSVSAPLGLKTDDGTRVRSASRCRRGSRRLPRPAEPLR